MIEVSHCLHASRDPLRAKMLYPHAFGAAARPVRADS